MIKKISHTYFKEKATGKFKGAQVGKLVRNKMVEELRNIEDLKDFKIKGSIGNGQFAAIPWVAIMDKDVTTTTSKGMYIVFLFSSDEKEVYLTLNQGAEYFKDKKLKDHDIVKISKSIYESLDSPESEPIDINLKSETSLGRAYEKTAISGFKYYSDDMPDTSIIVSDIIKLLNDYEQLVRTFKEKGQNIDQFYQYILNPKVSKYQLFKNLFRNFVEQSQINITSNDKSTEIKHEGLEDIEVIKIKDYNSINMNGVDFHVHLFNSGQYGRKNGNGSGKIPYICYKTSNSRWVNIRTTFEDYKMTVARITLWDEINKKEQETEHVYKIEEMDLFSDNPPNEYFKQFYNDYMNYKNEGSFMIESGILKDITKKLIKSRNIILRGAPGTGKSYLAKAVASQIIGISDEQLDSSEQFEFVQFHPNYDYTDFVQGIRPIIDKNENMGFKLKSGIFKTFCEKAIKTQNNNFSDEVVEKHENYNENDKKYVFVIDEINRGEISKIFGELFFSIDPSYRGITGAVKTQYSNMGAESDKFYIPENVYIIGTMNDIDRSVDTFDFAMRRRFRFIEIKANENIEMLESLGDKKEEATIKMISLNNAISQVEELDSNYHIGAAYFLKLKDMSFEELWEDYLEPLLSDYVRGLFGEEEIMESFKTAYTNPNLELGSEDESD
ncbi:MrcB family domain-containing protein [Staphylococcus sp. FSL K6-0223]|uniref:MrcB family domain-containing protein n=1 Tax=Staphylococcus sp. FSL K6-0223 TaxID=2921424 RepID=UPI0030FA7C5D